MKAIDIVQYLIDNDLTKQELGLIANRLLVEVSDKNIIREVKERGFDIQLSPKE